LDNGIRSIDNDDRDSVDSFLDGEHFLSCDRLVRFDVRDCMLGIGLVRLWPLGQAPRSEGKVSTLLHVEL